MKIYIIIAMILILIILIYHANIFNNKKELFDSKENIIKPLYKNIDNLDIKQLKNIVNEQNNLINKQEQIISNYIEKIELNKKKYHNTIIKPNEDIDNYFKNLREINDKIIKTNDTEVNLLEKNKKLLQIVKRYLEDPLMRGYNIYESEQYSKLLEIGNIQLDNKEILPKPSYWSKNINL